MSSSETDIEIIQKYLAGDEEAFKSLINRYASSLFNFCAQLIGQDSAEDIVQEVFIKVWKNLKKFDPQKASFKTWLFAITKNSINDFLRKKKSLVFSDLDNEKEENEIPFSETIPDSEILPDEFLQKLQDIELLNTVLKKLPLPYKTVLTLHYQAEMTFEEIGKILAKPLNTVKSQHRRALLLLKELINAPK